MVGGGVGGAPRAGGAVGGGGVAPAPRGVASRRRGGRNIGLGDVRGRPGLGRPKLRRGQPGRRGALGRREWLGRRLGLGRRGRALGRRRRLARRRLSGWRLGRRDRLAGRLPGRDLGRRHRNGPRRRRRAGARARRRGVGQRLLHLGRRREAVVGVLGHCPLRQLVEVGGQLGPALAGRGHRRAHVRVHLRDVVVALEGRGAGQSLEEHAAERVDVGAPVAAIALDSLGGEVVDRADDRTGVGQPGRRGGMPGDAEVGQIGVLALLRRVDQHVRRLDVAVDQFSAMRRRERRRNLPHEPARALGLQAALAAVDQGAQVRSLDVAHDQVEHALALTRLVDGDHVGVLDRRGDARLALEALAEGHVPGELWSDRLERHLAVERELGGAVDDSHPAPADDRLDPATRDERACWKLGHRGTFSRFGAETLAWASPSDPRWLSRTGVRSASPPPSTARR